MTTDISPQIPGKPVIGAAEGARKECVMTHGSKAEMAAKMSDANFLQLGDGKLAYIRRMLSDEIREMFPGAPKLQPGLPIWALLSADGTPIMLTDSREAAIANAAEAELITVAVH